MAEKNVGALPVVDNGQLVGMISERDYTRKVSLKGRSSKDTPARRKKMTGHVSLGDLVKWAISAQAATIHALEKLPGIIQPEERVSAHWRRQPLCRPRRRFR
jgi:CBS domain-containing protein